MEMLSKLLNDTNFETREFGFIRRDDKRMYRNKSFKEPKFLREYLVTFPVNHGYIGAVYEDRVMPAMNYNQGVSIDQTKWIGRELTFDLDLTDYDERLAMLELIWMVVLADNHLDHMEASLMRRLAGLLYIEDVDSGKAAKSAKARLGLAN